MTGLATLAAVGVVALAVGGAVTAQPQAAATESELVNVRAVLTPAQEVERPKHIRPGEHGLFTATLDREQATISWRLTFTKLSSKPIAAHLHSGARREDGGVLVTLCARQPPCKSGVRAVYGEDDGVYDFTFDTILHASYVQIHTNTNWDGELRGQIQVVPQS